MEPIRLSKNSCYGHDDLIVTKTPLPGLFWIKGGRFFWRGTVNILSNGFKIKSLSGYNGPNPLELTLECWIKVYSQSYLKIHQNDSSLESLNHRQS